LEITVNKYFVPPDGRFAATYTSVRVNPLLRCPRGHSLSGASRFRGSGHDIDLYPFGREEAPLVAESKARKSGNGFVQLERWLGDYDALFLRRNNADPMVLLPWRVWARLLERVRR
jgi:hypothetical protein